MHKVLLLAAGLATAMAAAAQSSQDSAFLTTEVMPLASESLLLDIDPTGSGFIAVGERGHILKSQDGETWTQVEAVPTRSTLNAVTVRGDLLWAVGHDAVILHSEDGGDTWVRQYADPAQSGEDDPNPFFDVLFVDDQRGFVLGSYGLLFITEDGGQSWDEALIGDMLSSETIASDVEEEISAAESYESQFGEEEQYYDYHLNGIAQLSDGTLFIAGEAGTSYLSRDGGESWIFVAMPYEGSMFGIIATSDDRFIAYGLRGHVLESTDGGETWVELETGTFSSLMGASELDDGTLVLVGANGEVIARRAGGSQFVPYSYPGGEDLGDVAPAGGSALIVVGEEGANRYTPGTAGS